MLSRPASRARSSAKSRDRHSCSLDLPRDSRVNTHHSEKAPARQVGVPHTDVGVKQGVQQIRGCCETQRCPWSRRTFFDDTSDLEKGSHPAQHSSAIRAHGSRQLLWSWATIDSQLAISLNKAAQVGARALMARWRLLGVLCRRRVHDTARAVAVHVNRAPSTEYMCATMCYDHGPTRATEYRKVPLCATTELHVTECHCATPRVPPDAAERRRASWSFVAEATECHRSPPSAHTAASNALYSEWH